MLIDHFFLALNSLVHKKLRSWLTLLGIFIGVAAVVSLIGLGEGLKTAINSQFGVSSTEVITVQAGGLTGAGPPGTGAVNPVTFEDSDAIEKISSVDFSIPRIIQSGKLEFNDRAIFGFAMSIPDGEKREYAYEILDLDTIQGRFLKDGDTKKVVLGYNFYSDSVGLGKRVKAGDSILIQDEKFEVVGITDKEGSFIFDNIVHMNEDTLVDLFDVEDEVSVIAVKVKDKDMIDEAKEDIEELMRKRRDVKEGEEDFEVQTPDAALDDVNSILTGVQIFIAIIASISILIGAIGIVNTMFTSVMERRKQIGIMKSIGGKNRDIFYIFLFESGLMGFMGGFMGTLVGTGVAFFGTLGINAWVNASSHPQINIILILGALSGSFFIGAGAGVIPALQAARADPVDALRG